METGLFGLRYLLALMLLFFLAAAACAPIGSEMSRALTDNDDKSPEVCPGYERVLANPNLRKQYIVSPPGSPETRRGVIGKPIFADSGERLELRWEGFFPGYHLYYFPPGQTEDLLIGECPFSGGCNKAYYMFEDKDRNGVPDAFRLIEYQSLDFAQDEKVPGYLDRYRHIYVVAEDNYCVIHDLLYYACPPPVSSELDPCATFCDPPYRTVEVKGKRVPLIYGTELIERGGLVNRGLRTYLGSP